MNFDDLQRETLPIYIAEAEEGLGVMEQSLIELERRPNDPDLIDEIFRAAHTLKGNSSAFGFELVVEVTHVLEGLLDRMRARSLRATPDRISLLLGSLDTLRLLVERAVQGDESRAPGQAALVAALRQVAESQDSFEAVAPPVMEPDNDEVPTSGFASQARVRGLRVSLDKLDRLLNFASEIAIARGRIGEQLAALGRPGRAALEAHRESERLDRDMQELVMRARMVELGPSFRQHSRTVRDHAAVLGKEARLVTQGEDVEVDLAVVEQLRDPLTHMIRNSLDHGIERPETRRAAGKPEIATLTLRAAHVAGQVVVQVEDDGAGLDRARILARGRERGLVGPDQTPTPAEIDRLIFQPGFSTSDEVTQMSGRGVGMDVVRRNVEALRGSVSIESTLGRGTCVTLRLPLTLAIIQAFLVDVGGEVYALPLEAVAECVELPAERGPREATGVANLRGEALPYVRLSRAFDAGAACHAASRENLVVLRNSGQKAGVVVDRPLGEAHIVIKPLPELINRVPGIAGTTILGNGSVALIVDVAQVLAVATGNASTAGPAGFQQQGI